MRLILICGVLLVSLAIGLTACLHDDDENSNGTNPTYSPASIHLNQIGFYPDQNKIAVIIGGNANAFSIISADDSTEQFSGPLSSSAVWPHSQQSVKLADFSNLTTPGEYRVRVSGADDSHPFTIGNNVNDALSKAVIKSYYYQRSGTELTAQYAGVWARPVGHPDTTVLVHASAVSAERPAGFEISSPGGWYDAGDYNKYIPNSGISVYTLLAAYEHYSTYFDALNTGIPESNNTLPDLLDEILWNIDWMLTMQDPNDGGVYHKLTTQLESGAVMPQQWTATRYVVQKSTSAALDFAATMAVASRVFSQFSTELPGLADQCLAAAIAAWNWAVDNPNIPYVQPPDIYTGAYAFPGDTFDDERAWAAAELYITTLNETYYTSFTANSASAIVPSWSDVETLAWISLAHHRLNLTPAADTTEIENEIITLANSLLNSQQSSAYNVAMGVSQYDFVWGSNAVALNQSIILLQAYRLTNNNDYLVAAESNLDYVLGRNAIGISFVTGHGTVTPMAIHHRISQSDGVDDPVPGLIAGGANAFQEDRVDCLNAGVSYPSDLPALSYLDNWCSYASNEICINWSAPLVYVTAALESIYTP